ncbi:MAG: small basic protein [Candidatus Omnitrophota bacterium]|nr:small basic protein [Candidatus Omnitrophota bacterium]
MTQHPSLKGSAESGKFRSVLKRYEKIKELAEKDKWDEEKDSIYNLPKVKRIKFKIKKAKAAAEEAAPAEAVAAGAEAAEGAPEKEGAPTKKGASAKEASPGAGKKAKK